MEIIFALLAVLLNIFIAFLISAQYRYLVGLIEKRISYFSSFVIVSLSFFLRLIMISKSGSLFGTPIAGKLREGISLGKGAIIIAFENITYTSWQLFILVFILAFNKDFIEENMFFTIPLLFLTIILMIFCLYKYDKFLFLFFKIYSVLPFRLKRLIQKTGLRKENIDKHFSKLKSLFLNKTFLLNYNFFSLLIILVSPFLIVLLGRTYLIHINYLDSFTIYWFSYILGRLSGLPLGLGVRDVSAGFLLTNLGISTTIALQIIFLYRLILFIPFFPVGLIYFINYGKEKILGIYRSK